MYIRMVSANLKLQMFSRRRVRTVVAVKVCGLLWDDPEQEGIFGSYMFLTRNRGAFL